jgi:hypothetical protein
MLDCRRSRTTGLAGAGWRCRRARPTVTQSRVSLRVRVAVAVEREAHRGCPARAGDLLQARAGSWPCGGCKTATSGPAWAASASAPAIAGLPLCLVLTGIPWRTTWKHRERGYRHLFWEARAMGRLGVRETSDLVAVDGWADATSSSRWRGRRCWALRHRVDPVSW